MIQWNTH